MIIEKKFNLIWFYAMTSTNSYVLSQLEQGIHMHYTGISAHIQKAGRGRGSRSFCSPFGNLYTTLVLPPFQNPNELSFLTCVSVGEALLELIPNLPISYKWPNDILVQGKKMGGILIEPHPNGIAVGIGLNIITCPIIWDVPTTFLKEHSNISFKKEDVLDKILSHYVRNLNEWHTNGFNPIRKQWLSHAHGLHLQWSNPKFPKSNHGIFCDLAQDGGLVLDTPLERKIIYHTQE